MNSKRFTELDDSLLQRCNEILIQRGVAYSSEQDRLENFKKMAQRSGLTPVQVCHIFLQKGLEVIDKFARRQQVSGETPIDRFADAINYLRLLWACINDIEKEVKISEDGKSTGYVYNSQAILSLQQLHNKYIRRPSLGHHEAMKKGGKNARDQQRPSDPSPSGGSRKKEPKAILKNLRKAIRKSQKLPRFVKIKGK